MNKKLWLIPTLLLWIFFSCQFQTSNPKTQIPLNLDLSGNKNLSTFTKSIHYLLLDDFDSIPLADSYKFIFSKKNIFVQDILTNSLHKFDRRGKALFVFKPSGEGPGEFIQMEDFQVFQDTLKILDRSLRKILTFAPNNKFLEEEKIPINSSAFLSVKNKELYFMDNVKDNSESNFILYSGGQLIEESVKIKKGFENLHFGKHNTFTSNFDDGFVFSIPYTTDVVFFNKELDFEKLISFDFGRYNYTDQEFLEKINISRELTHLYALENNLVKDLSLFAKLGDFYILTVIQSGKGIHYFFLDQDFNLISQFNSINNDLDQMRIRNIPWTIDQRKLVFAISSIEFYNDYIEKFSGKKVEIKPGNIHDFFQKNQQKLREDKTVMVSLEIKEEIK
nr:6-bladed beta-propeller [Algoriphagus sp.]